MYKEVDTLILGSDYARIRCGGTVIALMSVEAGEVPSKTQESLGTSARESWNAAHDQTGVLIDECGAERELTRGWPRGHRMLQ